MQSTRDMIEMHLNSADEVKFPLIPHIAPIWPPDKRIEYVKARKAAFRRFVRKKMILFKFLQSMNSGMKDLFSEVVDSRDDANSIVNLTRNFQEEQRKKHERIFEIQTEAYHRVERKKTAWGKSRFDEDRCKVPRQSLTVTSKGNLNDLPSQTFIKDFQLTEGHQKISKIEGNTSVIFQRETALLLRRNKTDEVVFPQKNGVMSFPQMDSSNKDAKHPVSDPRFQRLLTCLVPPAKKGEFDHENMNSRRAKENRGYKRDKVQSRLSGKTLHEKWLATMTP
ncbi:unnamed protein product [Pocillopora meandrina]|uniref:Uncharacterized protein n=1 Tax=Pocillopora meandrina TaxID=46732 RepID=A0AAU9X4B2_9CNID|nr:unnamed protein product [Pocillopora meandrina]